MNKYIILIVFAFSTILYACKKEDPNEYFRDYVKINGVEYPIEGGYEYDYGTDLEAIPPFRSYEINLTSQLANNAPATSIFFIVNSPSTTRLESGSYEYNSEHNERTVSGDLYDLQVEYDFVYDEFGVATNGKILYNENVNLQKKNSVKIGSNNAGDRVYDIEFNFIKNGEDYNVLIHYIGKLESSHEYSRLQ